MQYIIPKEIIEDYFSEYKTHMIWILCTFAIISGVAQYLQNLYLSKKIEKYKDDLKRNEIKFSRHNELQIESLKNLYDKMVTFHFAHHILSNPIFYTHHSFKNNLQQAKINFLVCMEYFHRNKIFLTEELLSHITKLNNNFREIEPLIDNALERLLNAEEQYSSSHPQDIYVTSSNEIEAIKHLILSLKSNGKLEAFEKDIKDIRDETEKYFKQLTT